MDIHLANQYFDSFKLSHNHLKHVVFALPQCRICSLPWWTTNGRFNFKVIRHVSNPMQQLIFQFSTFEHRREWLRCMREKNVQTKHEMSAIVLAYLNWSDKAFLGSQMSLSSKYLQSLDTPGISSPNFSVFKLWPTSQTPISISLDQQT